MNELTELLNARAERGTPRGADDVYDAATRLSQNAQAVRSANSDRQSTDEPIGTLMSLNRDGRNTSTSRWLTIAAAMLLITAGIGMVRLLDRPTDAPAASSGVPAAPSGVPATPDTWTQLTPPPLTPRVQYLSIPTPSGLFVWGRSGSDTARADGAFLDNEGQWRTLPDAPLDATLGDAVGVWTGSEVVVMNGSDSVYVAAFDPTSFTWRSLPQPATISHATNATSRLYAIDDHVVLSNLNDSSGDGQLQILDIKTSTWTSSSSAPVGVGMNMVRLTASDNALYAMFTTSSTYEDPCGDLQPIYRYDITANSWTSLAIDSPFMHWTPGLFSWAGDRLILAGGHDCLSGNPVSYAVALDPLTLTWATLAKAPAGLSTAGVGIYEDAIWTGANLITLQADGRPVTYTPSTNTWHVGPTFLPANETIQATPVAWFADKLVVWSAGVQRDEGNGKWSCCDTKDEAFAYSPALN